jgi:RHS repeat-associated protein
MPVTTYYSAGGVLLGESDSSGSRLDYLTDALGSVAGTVTSTAGTLAQLGNRYRYKPYGTQYVKTGTAPDPLFTWVGSLGYRQTARTYSDVYVRARHYATGLGRWTTKDPLGYGADVNPYAYAQGRPTIATDPTGLFTICTIPWPDPISGKPKCVDNTNEYADRARRCKNHLDGCASCVSAFVCGYVFACRLGVSPLPCPCGMPETLQCMNDCMIDLWRRRDTPRWREATAICRLYGEESQQCCLASVAAEQNGFTRCAPTCPPWGNLFDLWPEDIRKRFAIKIGCCSGTQPSLPGYHPPC